MLVNKILAGKPTRQKFLHASFVIFMQYMPTMKSVFSSSHFLKDQSNVNVLLEWVSLYKLPSGLTSIEEANEIRFRFILME